MAAAGEISRRCLGDRLAGRKLAHACAFLGPRRLYAALRRMDRREREQFCMTHISFVNQLYGGEELKRLQRKSERFVNSGLVATLSGAVASDTLEDERVLSGVGGQYNFGAPAHALDDGRSILMIRSTREAGSKLHSGIRWSYYQGHEMSFARSEVPLAIWDEGCRRAPWTGAKEESCL